MRFLLLILLFYSITAPCQNFHEKADLLISYEEIQKRVEEIAKQIDADLYGKEVVMVPVLKGAICIAADLIKEMRTDVILEPIRCSCFGMNGTKKGKLSIYGVDRLDLTDKHVLIVDDIYESGNIFTILTKMFYEKKAASVQTAIMLRRKGVPLVKDAVLPDYTLFEIDEDRFVVGYGLDLKERYRGLKGVYALKKNKKF